MATYLTFRNLSGTRSVTVKGVGEPIVEMPVRACDNCESSAFPRWEDRSGAIVCEACRVDDDVQVSQ